MPLDRRGEGPPSNAAGALKIEFELYTRRKAGQPSLGTLVDVEGGPGYSTTDSRDYFIGLNEPLMDRRDLLLVDARGTGLSAPLDCPAFANTVADYVNRAGRCANQLGTQVDYYGTHAAVDDLADVLDALGIDRIDLYGDSYGTYFSQAFAVRHGDRLRSLVLDAAYPLPGTDPAFSDLAAATRRALRLVCDRRPSCAARGQDPVAVVKRLVEQVRVQPVSGQGRNTDGERIPVTVDEGSLVELLQSGYGNIPMYRDLLAAIRSFNAGDRAPLFRLLAENTLDPAASPVRSWSEALYLAVTCHDYPQMWDPAAPISVRTAQLAAAQAALPAAAFAPFSGLAWTSVRVRGSDGVPALARPAAPGSAGAADARPTRACRRSSSTATSTTSPRRRARRSSPPASRAPPSWRCRTASTSPPSATATTAPRRSCAASSRT